MYAIKVIKKNLYKCLAPQKYIKCIKLINEEHALY